MDDILKDRKKIYKLRDSFAKHYNNENILKMKIYDYVISHENTSNNYNFCYTLERKLDKLGGIIGATALKFGIYFGITKSDPEPKYRWVKRFSNGNITESTDVKIAEKAFINIKKAIVELINDGKNKNYKSIVNNQISPMFKGKILSTFFPEDYLNIFSDDHLDYYLNKLDLDSKELLKKDAVNKRIELKKFKNNDPVMKAWSLDIFMSFLYGSYPGSPPKKNNSVSEVLSDFSMPEFPTIEKCTLINQIIIAREGNNKDISIKYPHKKNYENESGKLKKIGDRGEKIVFDYEVNYLSNSGRKDLAVKVKRVSLESDSYGYDILSFNLDGTEKHIEVKATVSNQNTTNFYLSENELQTAKNTDNYYVYMVYEVKTDTPKIWNIGNPFSPENKDILLKPTNYRISLKTKIV
jgi:hypothetical protein